MRDNQGFIENNISYKIEDKLKETMLKETSEM